MNEEELKRIKDSVRILRKYNGNGTYETKECVLKEDFDKLQNNWNELKKCIGEWILYHSVCEEDYKELNVLLDVESKMQELEGNNDSKRDV